jgi:hypothetical protein
MFPVPSPLSIRRPLLSGAFGLLVCEYKSVLLSCWRTDDFVSLPLYSSFVFERLLYLAPLGRPLGSPYIGLLRPLDGWGWDEGTAIWGSYRYPLRVLERVDPWVTSVPPLLFVWDGVIYAVHRLLMTTFVRRLFSSLLTAGSTFVYKRFIVLVPLWSPLESSVTLGGLSSTRQICLSGTLGLLASEYNVVLLSCNLTDEFVSFSLFLSFVFKRLSYTPSPWCCLVSPYPEFLTWVGGCPWNEGMAICRPSYDVSHILEHIGNWGSGMLPVPCLSLTAAIPPIRLIELSFVNNLLLYTASS